MKNIEKLKIEQKIISVLEDLVYEDINNEDYWKAVKEAKLLIKELKDEE